MSLVGTKRLGLGLLLMFVSRFVLACSIVAKETGGYQSAAESCDSGNGEECMESSIGVHMAQTLHFHNAGLDGEPTLPFIQNFPKHKDLEETFSIHQRIGINYKIFGTLLLMDDTGTEVDVLVKSCQGEPICIVMEIFKKWIWGAGCTPRTWRTLVKCLREAQVVDLADDIEKYFNAPNTENLHSTKVLRLLNDGYQVDGVLQLLDQTQATLEAIRTSSLELAGAKLNELSRKIVSIIDQMRTGKVRVGVVGLAKAGKSSFLNALLGKHFLPSSIQPQTANEVVIVHNMSTPDGELYCVKSKGHKPFLLASGSQEVFNELLKLNNQRRDREKTASCDKLVLHAPLQFLAEKGVQELKFEISDTPGYGEAGSRDINAIAEASVRQMSAFVLILNSRYLKTDLEWKLLNRLKSYHPELFTKLNRVLILVNHHDIFYSDSLSATIKPSEVPQYVSNYLREPEVLGYDIPPGRIVPLSSLWALRARTWSKANTLKSDPKAKTLYWEALLMLRYIGETDKADELQDDELSPENVETIVSLLEPFSNIKNVEGNITEMAVKHGGRVLLESAVDDTAAVISEGLFPAINELKENERLEAKESLVSSFEELDRMLKDTSSHNLILFDDFHAAVTSATKAQVSALHDTLQESLKSVVTSKLLEGLKDSYKLEDKSQVISQMGRTRDTVPRAALTKMKTDWLTASEAIRITASEQMRRIFSDIRAGFLSAISKVSRGPRDSDLYDVVEDLSSIVSIGLSTLSDNSASLVPNTEALSISALNFAGSGGEGVQDNAIALLIEQGKTQKFRTEQRKKCGGGFLGIGRSCTRFTVAIPYDQAVYSPNFNGFQSSFESVVEDWMVQYNKQIEAHLKGVSESTGAAGKDKLMKLLEDPFARVDDMLETSRDDLNKSKENISFLEEKREELKALKKKLRQSVESLPQQV